MAWSPFQRASAGIIWFKTPELPEPNSNHFRDGTAAVHFFTDRTQDCPRHTVIRLRIDNGQSLKLLERAPRAANGLGQQIGNDQNGITPHGPSANSRLPSKPRSHAARTSASVHNRVWASCIGTRRRFARVRVRLPPGVMLARSMTFRR